MKVSYSKVNVWNTCPFRYKLEYLEHLEPKDDLRPDNPLFIGSAIHEGIEKNSIDEAVNSYLSHYPEVNSQNDLMVLYIKTVLPKALSDIPRGEYEYKIDVPDEYVGYIDCLVKNDDGTYDILDFKCSNNVSSYKKSPQVHLYKYYFERLTGNTVRDLYYVFIPKPTLKLTEDLVIDDKLSENLVNEVSDKEIHFEKVEFNRQHVNYFFARKSLMEKAKVFEKRYSTKCSWCPFQKFCSTNGVDRSELK